MDGRRSHRKRTPSRCRRLMPYPMEEVGHRFGDLGSMGDGQGMARALYLNGVRLS
jgi:hypothetical protein